MIHTDIDRDGMLAGLNVEATVALAETVTLPVIASGGVGSLDGSASLKAAADERGDRRRDHRPRAL